MILKSLLYFIAAGLCEIGGGYLVWVWLRENRSPLYALAGAAALVHYGVIPTLQPANFGRV
jgi:small multidrug resistance family-3 protein